MWLYLLGKSQDFYWFIGEPTLNQSTCENFVSINDKNAFASVLQYEIRFFYGHIRFKIVSI